MTDLFVGNITIVTHRLIKYNFYALLVVFVVFLSSCKKYHSDGGIYERKDAVLARFIAENGPNLPAYYAYVSLNGKLHYKHNYPLICSASGNIEDYSEDNNYLNKNYKIIAYVLSRKEKEGRTSRINVHISSPYKKLEIDEVAILSHLSGDFYLAEFDIPVSLIKGNFSQMYISIGNEEKLPYTVYQSENKQFINIYMNGNSI